VPDSINCFSLAQIDIFDLCVVLKGEVTLILDTTEVNLSAGDSIVQKASAHAWANRSLNDCIVAISSHDGKVN
jgi:uncharacterized cupin superfamily protein